MLNRATDTAVRERPIILSGPEVRAFLERGKTQLRRVVDQRRNPHSAETQRWCSSGGFPGKSARPGCDLWIALGGDTGNRQTGAWRRCPFGAPGDRRWVREAWTGWALCGAGDLWRLRYAADGSERDIYPPEDWTSPRAVRRHPSGYNWASPILLPRWASRLTLEITDVRVERLQEISEEDARAEGLLDSEAWRSGLVYCPAVRGWTTVAKALGDGWVSGARGAFASAWDDAAAIGNRWRANLWVWVFTLRQVEGG